MSAYTPNTGITYDAATILSNQIVSLPTSTNLIAERGGCHSQSAPLDLNRVWLIGRICERLTNNNICHIFMIMNEQIDDFTIAILENTKVPMRLAQELELKAKQDGYPSMIIGDQTAVYFSHELTNWCQKNQVSIRLPHPHAPSRKIKLERVLGKITREYLNTHDFKSLHHLKTVLDDWSAAK